MQQGGTTYTYDANGNTLTETLDSTITTYTWDAKNKLKQVDKGGGTSTYDYNVDGIRIAQTVGSDLTQFVVDSHRDYAQVIAELDASDAILVHYTYGDDLISQERAGATNYYHYDGLGSTRALSDELGGFSDSYDYEAFGEVLNTTGATENSYLYTGEQFDSQLD
ncbi:MAG: type IV secretion protein Rhs, partial [Oleiphilaceae bacterium]|nr:type IV secretion protein Rhs [Oleiphilaceae bacterium]